MPAELYGKTVNLDWVYPPFLERHLVLIARCKARGVPYYTTEMHRPWERSDILYKAYKAGGPRAAPAGYSAHNFGLAADEALLVKNSPGRVLRWGPADFRVLGEECRKLGLAHGASFGDAPHIGWPGYVDGKQLADLRRIWLKSVGLDTLPRLRLCWDWVDTHSPSMPPLELLS